MTDGTAAFLALHRQGEPLLLPNPWDVGTARLFRALGFSALATTSAGHAGTLGRPDGGVSRTEALAHASAIVAATELPVTADLENGFADDPEGVAETVRGAIETGLAGCSIEDHTGGGARPIYERGQAVARIEAAAAAAHEGPRRLVLTARAENHLHGAGDLVDTIARLQAFQEAGADVLYAPGLTDADDIRRLVESVDRPVNVLALPGCPAVAELARLGVARISVGSGFHLVALGAVTRAAKELRDEGTYRYWKLAAEGMEARRTAFDERA